MKTTGIYVHIPFCKSKCAYCDFNSFAGAESMIEPYIASLCNEICVAGERNRICVDTVYIGGGTPTFCGTKALCKIIDAINSAFRITKDCEITAECNPGTADFSKLSAMRSAGINRLSIGLQSTDDKMLRDLGRIHTFGEFSDCFADARKAGFENISLDLMFGLPNQTPKIWYETLHRAAEFGAEHISCYALKLEEGTPLAAKNPPLPDDDTVADMYDSCVAILSEHGYGRYEISNFAHRGFESRHNLKYWHCDDFLGLGAGAFSCMGSTRFSNCAPICDYISKIQSGGSAVSEKTTLSDFDRMSEFVFLGLRCADGISLSEFKNRFDRDISEVFGKPIKKFTDMGFLISEGDRLRFAEQAFFVSNTVLSEFV